MLFSRTCQNTTRKGFTCNDCVDDEITTIINGHNYYFDLQNQYRRPPPISPRRRVRKYLAQNVSHSTCGPPNLAPPDTMMMTALLPRVVAVATLPPIYVPYSICSTGG